MGEKRVIEQIASDEIYNDDWFLKDSVLHDTTKVQPSVIKEYVNQGMATSQDLADEATARQNMDSQLASGIGQQMSNLADFYDTTKSYVVGDVCVLQSGELMRCIAPTSGTFDNTKWEQVTVDELFDDLNFSADAISYDNTSSGLEADNVQDAIGEAITKLSAVGSASGNIATFPDGSDLPMPKLEVAIEPQQDLHGYDSPWVGGAGKNKFDGTATLDNKWINANGEVESQYGFWTSDYIPVKQGDIVRRTATGSGRGAFFDINKENGVYSSGTELTASQDGYYRFCGDKSTILPTGQVVCTINNTDLTFAPYSNICPIIGWDEVNVGIVGKNLATRQSLTSSSNGGLDVNERIGNAIAGTQYTISVDSLETNIKNIRVYIGNTEITSVSAGTWTANNRNSVTFTANISGEIGLGTNRETFSNSTKVLDNIQLELGTTATAYEPYNGNTYTIQFKDTQGNPIEVFGGECDVVNGTSGNSANKYMLSNYSNIEFHGNQTGTNAYEVYFDTTNKIAGGNNLISNMMPVKTTFSDVAEYSIRGFNNDGSIALKFPKSVVSSLVQAKQWCIDNGLQILYEATSTTFYTQPTSVKSLLGVNSIYANTGNVLDAEYIRDMTAIINYILEQLNA